MKKNTMMRIASCLLIAVLMTTCVISGTFAKYVTTDTATDSARVAKWGVTITAAGDTAFAEKYDNTASASGTKVVSVDTVTDTEGTNDVSVLAPGTNGQLASLSIGGTPEVMVNVTVTAALTLTGWKINGVEYCPIVFTVNDTTTYQVGTEEDTATAKYFDTVAELETAIEGLFTAETAANVAANSNLAFGIDVDWKWDFEGNDDEKDTALGNLTGGDIPTIEFAFAAEVTQVD